jgi:hypothetical protein
LMVSAFTVKRKPAAAIRITNLLIIQLILSNAERYAARAFEGLACRCPRLRR